MLNDKKVLTLWCWAVALALVSCKGEKPAESQVPEEKKSPAAKALPTKSPGDMLIGEWVDSGWFVQDSGVFAVQAFNSDGELTVYVKTKEENRKPDEEDDDWTLDFDDLDYSTSPPPLPMGYVLDSSSTPYKLDMFVMDGGRKVGTSKAILEFITDDEIRIRTFDSPQAARPPGFLNEDDEFTDRYRRLR